MSVNNETGVVLLAGCTNASVFATLIYGNTQDITNNASGTVVDLTEATLDTAFAGPGVPFDLNNVAAMTSSAPSSPLTSSGPPTIRGLCGSNCLAWDWRLSTSAPNAALDVSSPVFPDAAGGPVGLGFYLYARETIGDGDLLCEVGESCLLAPNIGAYQGHGDLVSAPSQGDDPRSRFLENGVAP